jgi:hypothetical protein
MKTLKVVVVGAAIALCLAAAPSAHAQYVVPEVRVTIAPPPPRFETRTIQPTSNHVWINGHYAWRYGQHVWLQGHWAEPPQSGMVWENARWENRGGYWSFVEGHWRFAAPPQPTVYLPPVVQSAPVYVQAQPPPVISEVRTVTPYAGAVWIPGYWHWNGYNHVWVGGHWSAPRVGWHWEPDRWAQGPTGWYRVAGHWAQ